MDTERWRRLNELFDAALRHAPAQRQAFLVQECGGDEGLLREAQSLLVFDDRAGEFLRDATLSRPPLTAGSSLVLLESWPAAKERDLTGQRIGAYRLTRKLASGGMGAVWLAERADEQFRKLAAIKLIKPGMDSAAILQRFRRERQVLAGLEHPNIARLIDGGATEEGRPYLVMEYVEGTPIDRYCDEQRLSIAARLDLFLAVCGAVQYAHQNLVVHRDLKPSNILVTREGLPKLLDFGIARVVTPDAVETDMTAVNERPMTPDYAAPEQVRGESVTTATDVYSLGVVLYELLTGHRPYRVAGASLREVERVVCEQEPARPSTVIGRAQDSGGGPSPAAITPHSVSAAREIDPRRLRRLLSGDLDTIVLKALRKEPQRRYASAELLAQDIRRHVRGLPVMARPDTAGYRLAKFIRRHTLPVALTVGLFLLAIGFGVTMMIQSARIAGERNIARAAEFAARQAEAAAAEQARKAQVEAEKARQVAGFLRRMLTSNDPAVASSMDTTLLKKMLREADEHVDAQLGGQPEVLASIRHAIGDTYGSLAAYADAERNMREALRLREEALGPDHIDVARSLSGLASVYREQSQYGKALPLFERSLNIMLAQAGPSDAETAMAMNDVALVQMDMGDYATAEPRLRASLDLQRQALAPGDPELAKSLNNLALVTKRLGRLSEAQPLYEEAIEVARGANGADDPRLGLYLSNLAGLLEAKLELPTAEARYREAIEVQRRVFRDGHPDLAVSIDNLARVLVSLDRAEEAEPLAREAIAMFRHTLGEDNADYGIGVMNLANVLRARGNLAEAEPLARQALQIIRQQFGEQHPALSVANMALGQIVQEQGDLSAAEKCFRDAFGITSATLGPRHLQAIASRQLLARLHRLRGEFDAADALLSEALAIVRESMPPEFPGTSKLLLELGQLRLERGQPAEAEPLLRECLERRTRAAAPGPDDLAEAQLALAACLVRLEKPDEARALLESCLQGRLAAFGSEDSRVKAVEAALRELNEP